MNLDTPFPSGSWTLYFHSNDENKWDMSTFISTGSMKNWRDWWTTIETLKDKSFMDGMFFLMRDPIPPLWENARNVRGGSYSYRISKASSGDAFISTAIACMLEKITKDSANIVNGISISPKRGFNIIKVWNTDCTAFNSTSDIEIVVDGVKVDDIMYSPFLEKKM